jgi:hypothetical protein
MLQLLQPIWMFLASAMAIPLLIHLWNVRKGKRLQVGSLQFLSESIPKTARQIRIQEWWLLLLRCLLILLLALLLSEPVWKQHPVQKGKGWVLIPQESVSEIYPYFRTTVDSLVREGYEFHYFNYPFIKAEPGNTIAGHTEDHTSYWQRIAQLDRLLPGEWPVYVYTSGNISDFAGDKPAATLQVHWKTIPSVGAVAPPTAATDSTPFHITIYHEPKYQEDARYVHAALQSIRNLLRPGLTVSITDDPVLSQKSDWVFWLSDKPLTFRDTATTYLVYATGKPEEVHTSLINTLSPAAGDPVMLYRILKAIPGNTATYWKDGYGHPVLDADMKNRQFFLYTHFDPSWSNMVWEADFPDMLYTILWPQERTKISSGQIDEQLLRFAKPANKKTGTETQLPLSKYIWWCLLVCFLVERYISVKKRKKSAV